MSWHKTDLADAIASIQSGSRPKGGATIDTGEVMSLGGENILQQGGVELRGVKRVPKEFYTAMTKGRLQDRDVLINKDGANTGKVGLFRDSGDGPACINEHLFLLRGDSSEITQEYLYYTLLSERAQTIIRNRISGSAQPGLKAGFINNFLIDLPKSTDEQERISRILQQIDLAIEQTEELIAKQQRIKIGLMHDLLTKGVDKQGNIRSEDTHAFKDSRMGRIPMEWDVSPAEDLCEAVIDCKNRTPPETAEGHPVIRTPNVRDGEFVWADLAFTDSASYVVWTSRARPRAGDVVITREAPYGEACIIPDQLVAPCLGQRMMMYQPDANKVRADYLVYAIYSQRVQKKLLELAGGSTVGHIRVGDIRRLPIPHPIDVSEQENIGLVLNGISDALKDALNSRRKLFSLKAGLMHDLLTGERLVAPFEQVVSQ